MLGKVRSVHVTPSGEVATELDQLATAQNTLPFHAAEVHEPGQTSFGTWTVYDHETPLSVEAPDILTPLMMATMRLPILVTARQEIFVPPTQSGLVGKPRWVHVMPSADVADTEPELVEIAQKTEPFHVSARQVVLTGSVRVVQVNPSVDVAALAEPLAIAQKTVPLVATSYQADAAGIVPEDHVAPLSEEAAHVAELRATAHNTPPIEVTACQFTVAGIVRCVHVIPSGEVAATLEP